MRHFTNKSVHTETKTTPKQEIEVGYTGTPLRHSYNNQFPNKKKEEDDPTEGVETQHQFLQMFHERKKQQLL